MSTEEPQSLPSVSPGLGSTVLGHLVQIPGAVAAVARLIGKTAQLGEAWLDIPVAEGQRRAQAIRDDQAARSALIKILGEAASGKAVADPALIERAVDSWAGDRLRKQTNREAVAEKVVEDLKRDPPAVDASGPTDDWMNVFEEHAEKASSEQLRSLWAKVLSGEIRKSGSYTLRSLQFISILDKNLADSVLYVASFVVNSLVAPNIPTLIEGPGFRKVTDCVSTGLLTPESRMIYTSPSTGRAFLHAASSHYVVFDAVQNKKYGIDGWTMTSLGMEVFSLVEAPLHQSMIDNQRKILEEFGEHATFRPKSEFA